MADPLAEFEAALLADVSAFEAEMRAKCDKLQSTAQTNFDQFQKNNKDMQALLGHPAALG